MSGLLSRAGEAIRNSPLMTRKSAEYALAQDDDQDPFARGITFHVEYQGSEDLPESAGKGDQLNQSVIQRVNVSTKPPYRKFSVLVKDQSVRLKDLSTNQVVDNIPIYNISFCGSSNEYNRAFSLIVKNSDTGRMRCHVMRAADRAKAQAMVLCVSKAFNIAFLAWQAKNKHRRVEATLGQNRPVDSPRARRKMDELRAAEEERKKKEAAEQEAAKAASVAEVTEQMGAVSVTVPAGSEEHDEFEDAFTSLARARSHPDLLDTDVDGGADPAQFDWLEAQKHVDPGSTPNLLDIWNGAFVHQTQKTNKHSNIHVGWYQYQPCMHSLFLTAKPFRKEYRILF